MTATSISHDDLRAQLEPVGQDHLLRFWDELDDDARASLAEQIAELDLAELPRLIKTYVHAEQHADIPEGLAPAPYYPRNPASASRPWDAATYRDAGERLIAGGKVGCFTVAGGQGSRLGYDGPKGCYPTGAVSNKPLFQIFADGIAATQRTYDCIVPWYIMTSPLNHTATEAFFAGNDHFGLDPANIMFFQQGTMPSLDKQTGKVLLADKGTIATNPDGHGGAIKALHVSGAAADMARRGVEHLSYWQVDNPNVRIVDPVFLGLHASAPDSSGEFSSKMIPKIAPDEKVGVFCALDGRVRVIEYSDLPAELAEATHPDGSLRFLAGSIAIHAIGRAFIEKVATDPAFALHFHRAVKQVTHVNIDSGELVEPSEPNAVKLEKFVFDAIPLAEASIVFETDRTEEFAPVKNKTGVDSIESSKRLQTERAARWLEAAGVKIPRTGSGEPDCTIEISPLTALSAEQLRQRDDLPKAIDRGACVAL